MGRVTNKHISGAVGPVVFKYWSGQQLVAVKQGPIKQTEATKKSSNVYSHAVHLSKYIKGQFGTPLHDFQDGAAYNRMNSEISKILYEFRDTESAAFYFNENSFQVLSDFEFNINSTLINSLRVKPISTLVGNTLTVLLPKLKIPAQLKFVPKSTFCNITVSVGLIRLKTKENFRAIKSQNLLLEKDQQISNAHEFQFEVPNGCLCLVGIFLDYFYIIDGYKVLLNSKLFNPSAIRAAIISPELLDESGEFKYTKNQDVLS